LTRLNKELDGGLSVREMEIYKYIYGHCRDIGQYRVLTVENMVAWSGLSKYQVQKAIEGLVIKDAILLRKRCMAVKYWVYEYCLCAPKD